MRLDTGRRQPRETTPSLPRRGPSGPVGVSEEGVAWTRPPVRASPCAPARARLRGRLRRPLRGASPLAGLSRRARLTPRGPARCVTGPLRGPPPLRLCSRRARLTPRGPARCVTGPLTRASPVTAEPTRAAHAARAGSLRETIAGVESVAIPGVACRASRLVMGTVRVEPALWEAYVAAGGTCFDTARHYGDETEAAVGRLLERLGIRDSVVLVGKGAHTPNCRPEVVAGQLDRSLELLRTDRVDVYLLYRDDPSVPVEEFVDALDTEVRAGRAAAVGVSNWTAERFESFNAYAAREGRSSAVLISNQLSLAEMLEPVWAGCLRADTGWHDRTQTPLLAWSAQARGFFGSCGGRRAAGFLALGGEPGAPQPCGGAGREARRAHGGGRARLGARPALTLPCRRRAPRPARARRLPGSLGRRTGRGRARRAQALATAETS